MGGIYKCATITDNIIRATEMNHKLLPAAATGSICARMKSTCPTCKIT